MRIRYLLMNAYAVGGTNRTVVNMANALASHHDVEIVSVWRERATPAFAIDPRVRLRALVDMLQTPGWRRRAEAPARRLRSRLVPVQEVRYDRFNVLTDLRLTCYLRSLRDGVLVTTRPALNLLSARYAPATVVRVGQEHLHHARHKPELAREIRRWYPRLDAVTVLTEADERAYRAALGPAATRVARIPNGLPVAGAARTSGEEKVIVAAGRLVRSKGFDLLIEAFELVAPSQPDWNLKIFGGGKNREAIRRQIERSPVRDRVHLMGPTGHLEDELAAASIFVLSSRHEGFGMVIVEAMSHGLPVVSFDCPVGPREIITHGRDGLLACPDDPRALAAAMDTLMADDRLRREMGAQAVQKARRYDVEAVRPVWERLLAELAATPDDEVNTV
ncbi:glycosyltransferase family 4 protein [Sphaerisporangium rhizosphaerae]|uniref:Glycosyltransferase family 4 protein n=1 Tax=Sphaerisporangium rhizosphaerae TaxID=2269375 RepID=A0ABW2P6R4_9ACTN